MTLPDPHLAHHAQGYLAIHRSLHFPQMTLHELVETIDRCGLTYASNDPVADIRTRMMGKEHNGQGALLSKSQVIGAHGATLMDGVYLFESSYALCMGGGKGIGFQRHGKGYGVVQDMAGVVLDKSWRGGVAWRKQNAMNANITVQTIKRSVTENPLVVAVAQLVQRTFLAGPRDIVVHTAGHQIIDAERKKREAMLYQLACDRFGADSVRRCVRLAELERLELDIYMPGLRLAIEHQGQQHYKPVAAWGGEKALKATQERDCRKRALCKANNIRLLEWRFDEKITATDFSIRVPAQ